MLITNSANNMPIFGLTYCMHGHHQNITYLLPQVSKIWQKITFLWVDYFMYRFRYYLEFHNKIHIFQDK